MKNKESSYKIGCFSIIAIILIVTSMMLFGCSKDDDILPPLQEPPTEKTGLSIRAVYGFQAERVSYLLKRGVGESRNYGQSLKLTTHIELNQGPYILHGMKVYNNGKEIPFSAYATIDGVRKAISKTSSVRIKKGEVFKIYLY